MKRNIFVLVAFVLLALSLSACSSKEARHMQYDDNGIYAGFSDIPDHYTAADAASDGCLVIDTTLKPNEYGVDITDQQKTYGYEQWQRFLEKSEAGENAFLRVAHFIDGVGYYRDLYYCDGKYTIFDYNEYGISESESFQYLRRLEGKTGPASDPRDDCYYVLTDSMELTYRDVNWSFLSSDFSTVTDIPFVWLTFMIYFE